jgi:tetratricopeptide (TPR) repeat protein
MKLKIGKPGWLKLHPLAAPSHAIRHYLKDIGIALALALVAAVTIEPVWQHYQARQKLAMLRENLKAVAWLQAFDQQKKLIGQGSGFFITKDGELVTNYHVIKGATNVVARIPSGAYYNLKGIRSADEESDLAVLQFDARETPWIRKTGNSDRIQVGDEVYAIGTPAGLESSYSSGIVNNPSRKIGKRIFIQFTAPIAPDNGGGGLFNRKGELIGITAGSEAILEAVRSPLPENLNFAVPINEVKEVLSDHTAALHGQTPAYYYALGNLADNRKQWDKAIELYQHSLMLDPNYADAYLGLGGDYYQKGDYRLEVQSYEKATLRDPQNARAFYCLGSAYEETGDYARAIEAYKKALNLDPYYKDALYELVIVYLTLGDSAKARELLPRLAALDQGWGKELLLLTDRVSR